MRGRLLGAVAASAALLFLTGCGDQLRSSLVGQVGTRLVPALAGSGPSAEEAAAQAAAMGFGPDAIAANPENYMLFQVGGLGIAGLGRVMSEHDNLRTWLGDSGYSVTIENGLVVATRGFGRDLMAADVASVRTAIDDGGGEAVRLHDYLDSRDQIVQERYACVIVPVGPQPVDLGLRQVEADTYVETCRGARVQFENMYFIGESGAIIASRQFVSDVVGYLNYNII
jgi:hypothetical protein